MKLSGSRLLNSIKNKLPMHYTKKLDADITEQSVKAALNALPKGKAPGNDGLTIDYYDKFAKSYDKIVINKKSYNRLRKSIEFSITLVTKVFTLSECLVPIKSIIYLGIEFRSNMLARIASLISLVV